MLAKKVLTMQDVIDNISKVLKDADGQYVAEIYNKICDKSDKVTYIGDSMFEKKESSDDEYFAEILQHRIKFTYRDGNGPAELDESSVEHLEKMLKEGYREGELCVTSDDQETEYRGWWSIETL